MTKHLLSITFIALSHLLFAQINMEDSTVQVITYWDNAEKQSYSISHEKVQLNGNDTLSKELRTYDVEISVLSQTEESYTVQWLYKNEKSTSKNPDTQKLVALSQNLKVIFTTDELGVFVEIKNHEELKSQIQKQINVLKKQEKNNAVLLEAIAQIESVFSTKETLAASFKDIQLFHTFHGMMYKLGEISEGELLVPNLLYPEKPLNSDIAVYLDEINEEDANYIMRATQIVNQEQLAQSTLDYLTESAKKKKTDLPSYNDVADLTHETYTASRIHDTGWVIYAVQTTIVEAGGFTNVEELILEIK